jgi:predicted DNA binding CopG/RHH family protein
MPQPATVSSPHPAGGFARILASLTNPAEKLSSDRSDDNLADDITTLSYEQALRTHARRPTSELPRIQNAADEQLPSKKPPSKQTLGAESASARSRALSDSVATDHRSTPFDQSRKAASITIRLSKAECAQLHQRATEAGLTVSAYLRSCTCEVEALRTQVKETLAQLRSLASGQAQRPAMTGQRLQRSWWSRLILLSGGRKADCA